MRFAVKFWCFWRLLEVFEGFLGIICAAFSAWGKKSQGGVNFLKIYPSSPQFNSAYFDAVWDRSNDGFSCGLACFSYQFVFWRLCNEICWIRLPSGRSKIAISQERGVQNWSFHLTGNNYTRKSIWAFFFQCFGVSVLPKFSFDEVIEARYKQVMVFRGGGVESGGGGGRV